MLRQLIIYIFLSILIILFAPFLHYVLIAIDSLYHFLDRLLSSVINSSEMGNIIRQVLLLIVLPFTVTLLPAAIYQFITKKNMPYFYEITWCVWVVLVVSVLIAR